MTSDTGETNRMKPPLNRREFIAQATATAALAATASTAMAGMVRSKNSFPKSPTEQVDDLLKRTADAIAFLKA